MLASYLSTQIGPTATESGGQPAWAASVTDAIAAQPVVINQGSARMGPPSEQRECHADLIPRVECRCSTSRPNCTVERLCSDVCPAGTGGRRCARSRNSPGT